MVQMSDTLKLVDHWIQERDRCRYIVATGMHGVMEARRDPDFKTIVNSADLFVPDGISLVWVARRRGFPLKRRVCGSDLMWEFFSLAEEKGYRVFFYGDTEETLQKLSLRLRERFPRLQTAGVRSPPFRPLTLEEDEQEVRLINESGADVVWVGLGLPKQERWMFQHRDALRVPVVVGVGAAFKFLSEQVPRAPVWVGDHGLEWLWRLLHEPGRVWRRVLIDGPCFACLAVLELSGLKKYS
jgi:N-acetylglucosaminyldiphosphoundecaprenol N-acetyl-beta-D-mannosaminyltransferase